MPDEGGVVRKSVAEDDAYHLTPEGMQEPPRGWGQSLRYFGPGLILSASIVGSGELIATTTLGAQAGFAILWMVIFSTLVKVAVQVEFARPGPDSTTGEFPTHSQHQGFASDDGLRHHFAGPDSSRVRQQAAGVPDIRVKEV